MLLEGHNLGARPVTPHTPEKPRVGDREERRSRSAQGRPQPPAAPGGLSSPASVTLCAHIRCTKVTLVASTSPRLTDTAGVSDTPAPVPPPDLRLLGLPPRSVPCPDPGVQWLDPTPSPLLTNLSSPARSPGQARGPSFCSRL